MKGLSALVLLALLGLAVYNSMQIAGLREEVTRLNRQMAKQEKSADLLAEAMSSVDAARVAIAGMDAQKARAALAGASTTLGDAARSAGKHAGPVLHWMERQVSDLSKQLKGSGAGAP